MSSEAYALLKNVHRATVVLSISGFIARWAASLAARPWVRSRAAKTLPHVVDTLLLASAVAMAAGAGFSPGNAPWLTAKIVALLLYIAVGMLALSGKRTPGTRTVAGVAAVLTFGYMVAVAVTKRVWPFGL